MKFRSTILVLLLGILMAFGITAYADTDGTYVYSVTSIGNGAFKGCTSLAELTMPKDVYGGNEASRFGYIFDVESISKSSSATASVRRYIAGGYGIVLK